MPLDTDWRATVLWSSSGQLPKGGPPAFGLRGKLEDLRAKIVRARAEFDRDALVCRLRLRIRSTKQAVIGGWISKRRLHCRTERCPTVSVVIPVYRAEKTLPDLYSQLSAAIPQVASAFEIIFVEDGGGDGSWPIIVSLAAKDSRVRGIRLSRNYGQHSALLCGIRAAKYELILTMDDDLQHPVSEIAPMLAALTSEFDVVYGAPQEEQHGLLRDLASRLTKLALTGAMGAETARNVSAFRVFRTRLREGFQDYRSPSVSIDVLLTWATSRFAAIKVRHAPRAAGVSGYTTGKLIRHALDLMTGFSTLPLQVASFVGFGFVLFGFSILAYVLHQLSDPWRRRAGICLPGFDRRHLFGSPAFRPRHLRRVSRPHVLPQHGPSYLSDRRNAALLALKLMKRTIFTLTNCN